MPRLPSHLLQGKPKRESLKEKTELLIQAAGRNVAFGFQLAYLLTSMLLLIFGITFLLFAQPDEALISSMNTSGN